MNTFKRYAVVQQKACVACGSCADVCSRGAISVQHGCFAQVDVTHCVGCGLCARECPLEWTSTAPVSPWVVQFSFKLYSLMLTSEIIAIPAMIWFRPRAWCTFCTIGTLTQEICKIRNRKG
jgi:ferredoxin